MKLFKKGQGATEYLLMLAAVLVIVAIAVYYVTSTGGYPTIAASAGVDSTSDNIRINVESGTIPANLWEYRITTAAGSAGTWVTGTEVLDAPYVNLDNAIDAGDGGQSSEGTKYVSLRHKTSGHIYFTDTAVAVVS